MFKLKKDAVVYFNGMTQTVKAGKVLEEGHELLKVISGDLLEAVVAPKAKPAKKVEKKIEEPKEEILVEAPVAALEVEVIEEPVEEKPKRRRKK